ncbi:MAG: ferrous iron transport protein A [Acholeplasmataceae bacterium]|nr:ferrous iron transport protein A [Acholeplasmataceae bacterium]
MKLSELKVNETLRVKKISNGQENIKRRLNDLGITRGVLIKIKGFAPMGSPVHLELRGYSLALEKKFLAYIEGEKL